MAKTIQTAIALYDGVTAPLQSMKRAMDIVLNSFEAMQNASETAIDVRSIQQARDELARAEVAFDSIEGEIRRADQAQEDFNNSIRTGIKAADGLTAKFGKLKGTIAALGIGAGIKKLVDLSDSMTSTTARLNLIADDGGSIENLEQKLSGLSQTSTVTVNATDGGTVAELTDEMSALDQERTATVTATDNGSLDRVSSKIDSLNRSATAAVSVDMRDNSIFSNLDQRVGENREITIPVNVTDNGTTETIGRMVDRLNRNAESTFTATDNGTVGALKNQFQELSEAAADRQSVFTVSATDNGTISMLEQEINNIPDKKSVVFNAADNRSIAALDRKINKLNQVAAVSVDVTGGERIEQLRERASSLEKSALITVSATDNGTIDRIAQQIQNVDKRRDIMFNATDSGTIAALDRQIGGLDREATVAVNTAGEDQLTRLAEQASTLERAALITVSATDNGTIATLNRQIGRLPTEGSIIFTATDRGTIGGIEEHVQNVENYRGILFEASDNGTIAAINRQIGNVDQEAAVTVKTVGGDRIAELDQQANDLNRQALVTVNATDNGNVAALSAQIDDLNREANVAVDVTANVTDNNSVKILEQKIMASAQRSRAAYLDTANAIANMGANARSAFATNDELIAFMEQINKQFVIGGASAQGQAAAMLQLTQAMGAGALRGEELNSILENAPGIARAIEQYMGVAEGSIRSYAEEGLITADVVKNAIFAVADETNAKFESMPMTWAQVWNSMQNRGIQALEPLLAKINELANSDRMQAFVDGMMNAFGVAVGLLGIILDLVSGVGGAIYDNWSWIEPIVWGVVGAFLALRGAMFLYNTVQAVSTGLAALHAAQTMLAAGATFTAAAAQHGLNAALFACPITWIVVGIIALITVITAVIRALDVWGAKTHSVIGTICGLFMVAAAFVGNLFVALINAVIDLFVVLWNFIASFANFFGNVFNDPVRSICRLFFDLVDTVLSLLQTLASAIDTLFGSGLSGAVQGWRNSLSGWVDSTFGKGEEIMAKISAEDMHLGRFEYGAAFDLGAEFGDGISDSIGSMFETPSLDDLGYSVPGADTYNLGNALDGINANTENTAGNTADIKDALEITDEDLEYLRDIAEREAINRYTTAEIKVEQTNYNSVDKDVDLDGIMDSWAADFAQRLEISGEGVHV